MTKDVPANVRVQVDDAGSAQLVVMVPAADGSGDVPVFRTPLAKPTLNEYDEVTDDDLTLARPAVDLREWGTVDVAGVTSCSDVLDLAVAEKGTIALPAGKLRLERPLDVSTASVQLQGQGGGAGTAANATLLNFDSGIDGVRFLTGSQWSSLSGVTVHSKSAGSGAGDGITVGVRHVALRDVWVRKFGGHGVLWGDGSVAHFGRLDRVRSEYNGGNGFTLNPSYAHVCTLTGCDAGQNTGWGYHVSGSHNLLLNPHCADNAGGSYYDNGGSNRYLHPYVEDGLTDSNGAGKVLFDTADASSWGVWSQAWFARGYPQLTGGRGGWQIETEGGPWSPWNLHDVTGPDGGTWSLTADDGALVIALDGATVATLTTASGWTYPA